MKTKALVTIAFVLIVNTISAQDLIYTVNGQFENHPLALDSILVENLNNGTRLLFGSLHVQENYMINLSTGEQVEPSEIYEYRIEDDISISRNMPGNLGISVLSNKIEDAGITVFNMLGQEIWDNHNLKLSYGNTIDIRLPGNGLYIVRFSSDFGSKAFRASGSASQGTVYVSIDGNALTESTKQKSTYVNSNEDFNFLTGDSLRISTYRDVYYARPKIVVAAKSKPVLFLFELSTVDIDGTSDVYTNVSDSTFFAIEYSDSTGQVHLIPDPDSDSVHVGDIITIDLDTAGYLRKVISITDKNGEIILETVQASMNELFVNKAFKLNTAMIEPNATLKSTSSLSEISSALTDDQGYIHPTKVILFDSEGQIIENSAIGTKGTSDKIRQPIIHAYHNFSMIDLYGEQGDNVHFYIREGEIYFNTDAVFEFDFTYEGEFSEDTKVKKGDLNVFEFYLEATAGLLTKVALDMSKSWDKEDDPKHLFKIAQARAQFAVPPGVPVWIDFDVDLYRDLILHADASLNAEWGFEINDTLKVGGRYTRATKELTPISEFHHHDTIYPLNLKGEINASARLELYPRIEMKLYSIFGPYAEVVPYIQGYYNAAFHTQISTSEPDGFLAWNSGLDLGLDFRGGALLDIFILKKTIGAFEVNCLEYPLWRSPYQLELITTLPEAPATGNTIPLKFKVTDKIGLPVVAPIYFEGDGSFSKDFVFSNHMGEATVDWTIGANEGEYEISATIFNADESVIKKITESVYAVEDNPLVAEFTADTTVIEKGGSVTFSDQSTGDVASWTWDFGDGGTSTNQNPDHIFLSAGTYTVSLTATNSYGSSSEIKNNYIYVMDNGRGTLTDIDGNTYGTTQIGSQIWMAENLRTTKYNDGTDIPFARDSASWRMIGLTPGYCWYSDDSASYGEIYGALYNWYVVQSGNLCPSGWHVSTETEWTILSNFLGGDSIAGGKMKESGTAHWTSPNSGATNESKFMGLPSGLRGYGGSFTGINNIGTWWTAEETNINSVYAPSLRYNNTSIGWNNTFGKGYGRSVRCLRD